MIGELVQEAFPNETRIWNMDIQRDVDELKRLMETRVKGAPFESTQELNMDPEFKSQLVAFIQNFQAPIVKLTKHPEKV